MYISAMREIFSEQHFSDLKKVPDFPITYSLIKCWIYYCSKQSNTQKILPLTKYLQQGIAV